MPRKRLHQTDAERIQAHREREARRGRARLEVTLDAITAEWLRQEARETRKTVGDVVTELVNREIILRRSTDEMIGLWEVVQEPRDDQNAPRPAATGRGTSRKPT